MGALYCAAAAVLWGLWPFWVHVGPGAPESATIALLVAGIGGAPLALFFGRKSPRPTRNDWLLLGVLGLSDAGNAWCYFRALSEGAVAPAVLSHYLAPVLVALTAPLVLGERRSPRTPIALVLALAGTAILVLAGQGTQAAGASRALAFGSASAVFYAGNVLLSKRLGARFTDAELLSYHAILSGLLLLPLTGLPSSPDHFGIAAVAGLVSTLLAGLLYYAGLRRMSAERAAILGYLEPLAAVIVSVIALGETPSAGALVGGPLVLAGGIVAALPERARRARPSGGGG